MLVAEALKNLVKRLVISSALLMGILHPVLAQQPTISSLSSRMDKIQADLLGVQQKLVQLQQGYDPKLFANQEIRLQELQNELTFLNGQLEELGYAVRQLNERLDRSEEDTAFRLRNLEEQLRQGNTPSRSQQPQEYSQRNQDLTIPPYKPYTSGRPSQTDTPQPPRTTVVLPSGSIQSQYDFSFSLIRQGSYEQASLAFQEFIENYPNHELAGNAQYWLGETYYARKDYVRAAQIFAEGFKKYPTSTKAPDNLLKLALSFASMDAVSEACSTLRILEQRFPQAAASIIERAQGERRRLNCPLR